MSFENRFNNFNEDKKPKNENEDTKVDENQIEEHHKEDSLEKGEVETDQENKEDPNSNLETYSPEEKQKENLERRFNQVSEDMDRIIKNISGAEEQKREYADFLDQKVMYTRKVFETGEARLISDAAKEWEDLWSDLKANPIIYGNEDFENQLQEKGVSQDKIEQQKKTAQELKDLKAEFENKFGNNVGFRKTNDIKAISFPYLSITDGNHSFDKSLENQPLELGDLLDKEIELKHKELEESTKKLEQLKEEKEELEK